jgi:hypothetical protein
MGERRGKVKKVKKKGKTNKQISKTKQSKQKTIVKDINRER